MSKQKLPRVVASYPGGQGTRAILSHEALAAANGRVGAEPSPGFTLAAAPSSTLALAPLALGSPGILCVLLSPPPHL